MTMNDKELMKNAAGYQDPTAYTAVKNIQEGEARISKLVKTIFYICELAGFHLYMIGVYYDLSRLRLWITPHV